ncbi:fumarate hydratase C-terminal domain-containing protein [Sphingobium sp. B12D2B]|uniref:fumarate hydratase C-terminal domain-containing protein n=1 Tax=Sphingobium sp. B12D2B TaxID=2940577 RepID=UPI0022242731|nr:fumarate hydratase C-terminal domain-containing protein [Sphingobium sp. B12D2B]
MAVVSITCPPSREAVAALNVGDLVFLSGDIVVTGGLPAHKRMIDCLDRGLPLPLAIEGVFIHLPHMIEARPDGGYDVQYVNPTTSRRFDAFMPQLIRDLDLRIVGGKGGLGADVAKVMAETGCVYLSLLGGGSPILSEAIKEVLAVEWRDFPSHFRLSKMRVENLGPLTVGIDARGRSIYQSLEDQARSRLPAIMQTLKQRRVAAERSE